jgi:hypothetical protein
LNKLWIFRIGQEDDQYEDFMVSMIQYIAYILITSFLSFGFIYAEGAYVQVSSYVTQIPTSSKGSIIQFETPHFIKNFNLSEDRQTIKIDQAGVYFISLIFNAGSVNAGSSGYIDCWFVKNGKALPGSNTRASVDHSTSVPAVSIQFLDKFEAGDTLNVVFATSGPGIGIISIKPDLEPMISSVSFCVHKID